MSSIEWGGHNKAATSAERVEPRETDEAVVKALAEKIHLAARESGDTEMTITDAELAATNAAIEAEKLGTPFTLGAVKSFDEDVRAAASAALARRAGARPAGGNTLIFDKRGEYVGSGETPTEVNKVITQERNGELDQPQA